MLHTCPQEDNHFKNIVMNEFGQHRFDLEATPSRWSMKYIHHTENNFFAHPHCKIARRGGCKKKWTNSSK